jgi:hypothetical protein
MVKPRFAKNRQRRKLVPLLLFSVTASVIFYSYLGNGEDIYWLSAVKSGRIDQLMQQKRAKNRGRHPVGGPILDRRNIKDSSKSLAKLLQKRNKIYRPHGDKGLTSIRLIGERHSGTGWATDVLMRCFPTVNVHNTLVNQKHWIQHPPEHVLKMVEKYGATVEGLKASRVRFGAQFTFDQIAKSPSPKAVFNQTFVVAIFRDPYDWMNAMRRVPHHWPNHQEYDMSPQFRRSAKLRQANRREGLGMRERVRVTGIHTFSRLNQLSGQQATRREEYMMQQRNVALSKITALDQPAAFRERVHGRQLKQEATPVDEADTPEDENQEDDDSTATVEEEVPEEEETEDPDDSGTIPLPWKDFVRNNMTILAAKPEVVQLCQKGFDYGTISPCQSTRSFAPKGIHPKFAEDSYKGSPNEPVYELKSYGTPYTDPLEFRTAKIKNFLEVQDHWDLGGFLAIKYEDLKEQGTQFLLEAISKEFGIKPECVPQPPNAKKGNHALDPDFVKWITENADWETEAKVGYYKARAGN